MNVPNLNQESFQQILPIVQKQYPQAHLRKDRLGFKTLRIPYKSFWFVISKSGNDFKIDLYPSFMWVVVAILLGAVGFSKIFGEEFVFVGIIVASIGVLIAKAIFRRKNKEGIEQFYNSFSDIVNGSEKISDGE